MAANRVSGVTLEVLHPGVAKARISGLNMEVLRAVDRSYGNGGGRGNRIGGIDMSTSGITWGGTASGVTATHMYDLIDGVKNANNVWFASGTGSGIIEFDFRVARVIDEATWYQDVAATHGTWKWQGWNGSAWVDIGSTFTLGPASGATQIQTTLNANTTAYTKYRLFQTAGSISATPYIREIEFSINPAPTLSYWNTGGQGDRSASIPSVSSTATWNGGASDFSARVLDGLFLDASAGYLSAGQSGVSITFDFGVGVHKQISEMRLIWSGTTAQGGTWKVQASDDNSSYTDLATGLTLGGSLRQFIDLSANVYGYRYYRLLQVGGVTTNTDYFYEAAFQIGNGATAPAGGGTANLRNLLIVN
jgi:hypothetical protein